MKKSVLIAVNIFLVALMIVILYFQSSAKTDIAKGFDGHSSNSNFVDNADIIENSDDITELIQQTSEELQMNIYVYIAGSSDYNKSDYEIETFADSYYDEIFGEETDGVFYYIDLSGRSPAYDYISTSGKAVLLYQKNIDNIFSQLDNYLPASGQTVYSEDIENAIEEFLNLLKRYSNKIPSSMEYYYDESSGKYMFMKNGEFLVSRNKPITYNLFFMGICIIIGLVTTVIVYFVTKHRYKFKKSQNSMVYVKNEKTVFNKNIDMFIRTYTTKHKIETSSSSGSRGGGGHSGGGHGGGGHHR